MEEHNFLEMVPFALEEGQQLLLSSLEHMGQFLQDGENEQNVAFFLKKLKLYCD